MVNLIIGFSSMEMVANALNYRNTNKTDRRKHQTSIVYDSNIQHYCKIKVNTETHRTKSPRKVPQLKKKHLETRIKFAKQHVSWPVIKWRNILWSDESIVKLFASKSSKNFVRRSLNMENSP